MPVSGNNRGNYFLVEIAKKIDPHLMGFVPTLSPRDFVHGLNFFKAWVGGETDELLNSYWVTAFGALPYHLVSAQVHELTIAGVAFRRANGVANLGIQETFYIENGWLYINAQGTGLTLLGISGISTIALLFSGYSDRIQTTDRTEISNIISGPLYPFIGSLIPYQEISNPQDIASSYWVADWGGHYSGEYIDTEFRIEEFSIGGQIISSNNQGDIPDDNSYFEGSDPQRTLLVYRDTRSWLVSPKTQDTYKHILSSEVTGITLPKPVSNNEIIYHTEMDSSSLNLGTKLDNTFSGIVTTDTFRVTLINSDGKFDDVIELGLNYPVRVLRGHSPDGRYINYRDYVMVRQGISYSMRSDAQRVTINVKDQRTQFDQRLSRTFSIAEFDLIDANTLTAETLEKPVPVIYGIVLRVPGFEIERHTGTEPDTNEVVYYFGDNITSIDAVYGKGFGEEALFKGGGVDYIDEGGGKIRILFAPSEQLLPIWADASSSSVPDRVGDIVIHMLETYGPQSGLVLSDENFDYEESQQFIALSPRVGLYLDDQDLSGAIGNALLSTNGYLIQKLDGRMSLRMYGEFYLDPLLSILPPDVIVSYGGATISQKNFLSSSEVGWQYSVRDKKLRQISVCDEFSVEAFLQNNKLLRKSFRSFITDRGDAEGYARDLAKRFSVVSESITVSIGVPVYGFNLLDVITLPIISGDPKSGKFRRYTNNQTWIIMGIDPKNDKLTLERLSSPPMAILDNDNLAILDNNNRAILEN